MTCFADTSRTQLFYVEETNIGETPALPLKGLRFTGESLNFSIENTQSQEIRSDRQITDLIQTDAEPSGDVNFELSYLAYDDLFEGALFDNWGSDVAIAGATDIEAIATDSVNPDTFSSTSTDFVAEGIRKGQWIKIDGFSNADNNGYFLVLDITSNTLQVSGETLLVDEAAGASVDAVGKNIRNGTEAKSYTLETAFTDVNEFKVFTGMLINSFNLSLSVGEILSGSFGFLGKEANINTATVGTGAPIDAPANDVMNAVNNVAYIGEGGAKFPGEIQEFSIALANNLRGQKAVGTLGNVCIGVGRVGVTGTLNAYFKDGSIYKKYVEGTESSISLRVKDIAGNNYIFTLPRIKFVSSNLAAGSADSDIIMESEYQAIRHPDYDFTIQIDKFDA